VCSDIHFNHDPTGGAFPPGDRIQPNAEVLFERLFAPLPPEYLPQAELNSESKDDESIDNPEFARVLRERSDIIDQIVQSSPDQSIIEKCFEKLRFHATRRYLANLEDQNMAVMCTEEEYEESLETYRAKCSIHQDDKFGRLAIQLLVTDFNTRQDLRPDIEEGFFRLLIEPSKTWRKEMTVLSDYKGEKTLLIARLFGRVVDEYFAVSADMDQEPSTEYQSKKNALESGLRWLYRSSSDFDARMSQFEGMVSLAAGTANKVASLLKLVNDLFFPTIYDQKLYESMLREKDAQATAGAAFRQQIQSGITPLAEALFTSQRALSGIINGDTVLTLLADDEKIAAGANLILFLTREEFNPMFRNQATRLIEHRLQKILSTEGWEDSPHLSLEHQTLEVALWTLCR